MDAGPDALSTHERPLGAGVGDPELGPISPELALVDPELARRARELLPEPRERPRLPRPLLAAPALAPAPAPPPPADDPAPEQQPEVQRPRRWARALALAIVIFVAGAASGTFLGNHQTGSPATTLEVRAVAPATTQTSAKRPALRPPKVSPTRTAVLAAPRRRRQALVDWATNVLGVEASVGRDGVALLWLRPADSARVFVLRRRNGGSRTAVVYRGRATRFHDSSVRPCTGYRYTIVNVDRRGHRSTGVPTSVVTRCG